MSAIHSPMVELRHEISQCLDDCRVRVGDGTLDAAPLGELVRAYCEALAALPRDEARDYVEELEALLAEVTAFGGELALARDAVQSELADLGRLQRASTAYATAARREDKK